MTLELCFHRRRRLQSYPEATTIVQCHVTRICSPQSRTPVTTYIYALTLAAAAGLNLGHDSLLANTPLR